MSVPTSGAYPIRHSQLLLRWRWLVLIVAIPISVVIEVLEGRTHDLQFLDEVIIDGLVLPVSTWIVLTFAARSIERQAVREQALETRQRFLGRLAEHRDYFDLTRFVVEYPVTLLPVEHVSLFVQDEGSGAFALADEWNSAASGGSPSERYLASVDACRSCPLAARAPQTGVCSAHAAPGGPAEHCVPLVVGDRLVGLLRLRATPGRAVTTRQLAELGGLAGEIARALALAIEDSRAAERMYHEAQANERRRIAHQLHDSLAQQVFYLQLGLDELSDERMLPAGSPARQKLAALRDVAAEVYDQIRDNLSVLRTWEQVNLTDAASDLARVTAHNAGIEVDVRVTGEPLWLPPHMCEHLYGVVREGLNNIQKHARASRVLLELDWSPDRLSISLRDDGVGFEPAAVTFDDHYGLQLIREAVESLDGRLAITSRPGAGTTLLASVPLYQPERVRRSASIAPQLQDALDLRRGA